MPAETVEALRYGDYLTDGTKLLEVLGITEKGVHTEDARTGEVRVLTLNAVASYWRKVVPLADEEMGDGVA